jgi:UDP-N-acetylmuramoylalanine--D-glutamate ligase
MITDFQNLRVTVMGLGTFGGGLGVVRFLSAHGARVTVTDQKPAAELTDALRQLTDCPGVVMHLGAHQDEDFTEADLIVASPAVPRAARHLQLAKDAGIPITSEMNLFWERNRGRTICITGSNGKSTTTALAYAMLCGSSPGGQVGPARGSEPEVPHGTRVGLQERVWLGGNIGVSLLPVVEQIAEHDWVVLELSSFQLEDLADLQPDPQIAVVTNFSPNHLDRHGTLDAYRRAKQHLLRWQTSPQVAILNADDPDVRNWPTNSPPLWFGMRDNGEQGVFAHEPQSGRRQALCRTELGESLFPLGEWLPLPGDHNFQNALAASCAVIAAGGQVLQIQQGLSSFRGLPHRLQCVGEARGRRFYNDSKATTPDATILALKSFSSPIVLLAGGYDKGIDLSPLVQGALESPVRAVALLGETGEQLQRHFDTLDPARKITTRVHASLPEAFAWSVSQSNPGDAVLLSPGCASYDWFANYEVRGNQFTELARDWCRASGET